MIVCSCRAEYGSARPACDTGNSRPDQVRGHNGVSTSPPGGASTLVVQQVGGTRRDLTALPLTIRRGIVDAHPRGFPVGAHCCVLASRSLGEAAPGLCDEFACCGAESGVGDVGVDGPVDGGQGATQLDGCWRVVGVVEERDEETGANFRVEHGGADPVGGGAVVFVPGIFSIRSGRGGAGGAGRSSSGWRCSRRRGARPPAREGSCW